MKPLRPILIVILIGIWAVGMILFSLKDAGEQNRFLKSRGMILIQGGCYEMGDPSGTGKDDEHPVHMVCIDPFYVGKEWVTVGTFKEFVAATGYRTDAEKSRECEVWDGQQGRNPGRHNWQDPGYPQTESSPAVCVSWNDAEQFIHWFQEKSPKKGMAYRLPTEGEWEFAARNRSITFHRSLKMREWLFDWYGENFYKEGDKTNPSGPSSGKYRVLRGDSPMNQPEKGTLFSRFYKEPGDSSNEAGFRLALPMTDR